MIKIEASRTIKKKVVVIINPISGGINKDTHVLLLKKLLDKNKFDFELCYTEAPNHATEIAYQAIAKKCAIVVAVGGDGTINEIGNALIGSNVALGIIPTGSGNGLANHLQIPRNVEKAITIINACHIETIDTVQINAMRYLGMSGVGFDAEISFDFANFGRRGFFSYIYLTLKKLFKYHRSVYDLEIDGNKIRKKAFLIAFANSNQFGNNAYIAPKAAINDGYLDVVILKKVPLYAMPAIGIRLFNKKLHQSNYVKTIRCKEIKIFNKNLKAHIDGEPKEFNQGMHLKIIPSSLKIIVPENQSTKTAFAN